MVSYFQSTRPDLSLMSPSHCIKNALWVNKCTHRVTMKRPESEIFSVLEKVHIFSAAFSAPCSPRKTAVRETEGYSWCFPSIYVEHELVVPSGLALVGVCTFLYGNYLKALFFQAILKMQVDYMNNNLSIPLYSSSWAFMLVLKLLFSHHVPKYCPLK